jgi:hypothetical protein
MPKAVRKTLICLGIAYGGLVGISALLWLGATAFHALLPWIYEVLIN